ncbi:hypothetical protein C9424_05250 [Arthrobacter sp. H-02-3]|nr:hypothetical protein C9424_05250 [Arthrobacter sp. H-02-3]
MQTTGHHRRGTKNRRADRGNVTGRSSSGQRHRFPPNEQKCDATEDYEAHATDEERPCLGRDGGMLVPD